MKAKSYIVIFFWLLIATSFFWKSYSDSAKAYNDLAFQTARSFFNQLVVEQEWNAGHGGIYVPITPENQPNSYLDDPLRDIESKEGMKLTKINPEYMTRQISEIASSKHSVQFHITSLKLTRPANKAAEWERVWLESFETGDKEQGAFFESGADSNFRYMAPLVTTAGCLECHAEQGYKEGDIRGGISVVLPFALGTHFISFLWGYGIIALIVSFIIYIAGHMLDKKEREQQALILNLQAALSEIKTLRGIIPICMICHNIKSAEGAWNKLEKYIEEHSDADFSHGICPDCLKKEIAKLPKKSDTN